MASLANPTTYMRNISNNSIQTLSEYRRRRNVSQPFYNISVTLMLKLASHFKKISDQHCYKYKRKIPLQNTSKPNSVIYKNINYEPVGFILGGTS